MEKHTKKSKVDNSKIETLWKLRDKSNYNHIFRIDDKKFRVSIERHPNSNCCGFNTYCCVHIMRNYEWIRVTDLQTLLGEYKKENSDYYEYRNTIDDYRIKIIEKLFLEYIFAVYVN